VIDPNDNGFSSRKLLLSIGIGVALIGCWLLTGVSTKLAITFGDIVGALLGVLGIYATGNVANKFAVVKSMADAPAPPMVVVSKNTAITQKTQKAPPPIPGADKPDEEDAS
jgi:hypothetical protein